MPIPPDNPYAGNALCSAGDSQQPCPEIFAYGFRNPWRWSFDKATGDLWVGDVGQATLEEVDRVTTGGNYGWRCFEGTQVYNADCGPNASSSLPPGGAVRARRGALDHGRIRLSRQCHTWPCRPICIR